MGHKASHGYGMLIGASVVIAATATVYFVSVGYSRYQQNQAQREQTEQVRGVPVSAIELPPPNIPASSQNTQEDLTPSPSPAMSATASPSPTISPTGSITPESTSTTGLNIATSTPTPTLLLSPTATPTSTATPTPSATLLVDSPTPRQTVLPSTPTPSTTQPSSTPTPIPPTSTNTRVPTIDPKLCKVAPEETRHPHYCTPTPGS